ncbi:hypothetical protein [Enterococcus gallinarum]|uniref:hypothetical protein n=1 Tax=Enterococcus gallinarum TaxID=1353 RepID=UPI0015C53BE4|nr:hypothetical protein [Enterococcus gallinarum]NQE03947.1 hypothetical protein [Enterococcus gallinarum]
MIILNFIDRNKKYFLEISDLAMFIGTERKKLCTDSRLNTYDYILINIVKHLEQQQRKLIHLINSTNFKITLNSLIELDAKISDYLFFLINCRFENDKEVIECIQSVEKDSLDDYYCGLNYSDVLNNYKMIVCN